MTPSASGEDKLFITVERKSASGHNYALQEDDLDLEVILKEFFLEVLH